MTIKILAFAGSLRKDSWNKKLIKIAVDAVTAKGASVTHLDLADFPMALYDGDDEVKDGIPDNAHKIRALMKSHQGFLISSPEYNSSISGVLKNVIDWASRPIEGEPPLACFKGKVVGLMSTSPGGLGGLRALVHVRSIFSNIGSVVIPGEVAVPKAMEAFDENGDLTDENTKNQIISLSESLILYTQKIHG